MDAGGRSGRAIVFGLMFDLPYAGIIAQFLHYLHGLRSLGWDVWYVEDTLSWPYDPVTRTSAADPAASIARVARTLEDHGFGDRWIYRCAVPDVRCVGAGQRQLDALYRTTDVALNVTGAQEIREEHGALRCLAYVQSDPFGLQVDLADGNEWAAEQMRRHHIHFTFGELIGTPACPLPAGRIRWLPTRQPVALELWPPAPQGSTFTTVTTWRNHSKDKVWQGERYHWTKDREFLAFVDLPRHTGAALELAVDEEPPEAETMRAAGWRLVRRPELATDLAAYQAYISGSCGEFTVARDQVVRPRTGWFSDRSASYLAAGRPVVTQETGFSEVLPTGEGLFGFSTLDEAAAALEAVRAEPARHAGAARQLAAEHFAAERVIGSLLERLG